MKRVCVYCGSSGAVAAPYRDAASELGARLAAAGIGLVYGGGRVGLMGLLADAALAAQGRVTGIIPARLRDAEVAHRGVTDAFAILPGGIGTLDEMFEIVSWKQLRLHDKPILLVDIGGYWAPLLALLDHIVDAGFAGAQTRGLLQVVPSIAALMAVSPQELTKRFARPELRSDRLAVCAAPPDIGKSTPWRRNDSC